MLLQFPFLCHGLQLRAVVPVESIVGLWELAEVVAVLVQTAREVPVVVAHSSVVVEEVGSMWVDEVEVARAAANTLWCAAGRTVDIRSSATARTMASRVSSRVI